MPVTPAAHRYTVPKGSRTACATVSGVSPTTAYTEATSAFQKEFGRTPDWERTTVVTFFTTFDTYCEIQESPEN